MAEKEAAMEPVVRGILSNASAQNLMVGGAFLSPKTQCDILRHPDGAFTAKRGSRPETPIDPKGVEALRQWLADGRIQIYGAPDILGAAPAREPAAPRMTEPVTW